MIESENSLESDISKLRAMCAALSANGPTPLLRDFLRLLTQMCAQQEKYLFTRGELLSKSAVRDIANGIGRIMIDELKAAGVENRQAIVAKVNARTMDMIRVMNNQVKLPAKRLS
jgi:hypothetical protein